MQAASPLRDVCRDVYFPQRLSISSRLTEKQYEIAIRQFGRHLGHEADVADLTDEKLYSFVRHLQSRKLSPTTINDRVGRLKTLWDWLARRKLVEKFPTVERVREPRRMPRAWNQEQLELIFASVAEEDLPVGGIDGRLWWRAFFAVAWNTSERVTAILSLRWDWLEGSLLHVPAEVRKGSSRDMLYELWDEVTATLEPIRVPTRELILPFPHHMPSTFYNRFTRILKRVGLPHDRRCKSHRFRVSHATWVRALSGHAASNLGHASEETTRRHYEDPRICQPPTPRLFIPWLPTK